MLRHSQAVKNDEGLFNSIASSLSNLLSPEPEQPHDSYTPIQTPRNEKLQEKIEQTELLNNSLILELKNCHHHITEQYQEIEVLESENRRLKDQYENFKIIDLRELKESHLKYSEQLRINQVLEAQNKQLQPVPVPLSVTQSTQTKKMKKSRPANENYLPIAINALDAQLKSKDEQLAKEKQENEQLKRQIQQLEYAKPPAALPWNKWIIVGAAISIITLSTLLGGIIGLFNTWNAISCTLLGLGALVSSSCIFIGLDLQAEETPNPTSSTARSIQLLADGPVIISSNTPTPTITNSAALSLQEQEKKPAPEQIQTTQRLSR